MSLEFLISPNVPVVKLVNTGEEALVLMDDHFLNQLPVVIEDDYIALINQNDILDWDKPESSLNNADFLNFKPIILSGAHPFEALNVFHQMNLSILPVIDNEQKYIGSITKESMLSYISENTGINAPGGIIVLELLPRNYTLYEIARICENEDVIITNASLRTTPDGMLEVTLKLNRTIIDAVVASFERHKYNVKEVYGTKQNQDDLTDNYNLLMTYLDM